MPGHHGERHRLAGKPTKEAHAYVHPRRQTPEQPTSLKAIAGYPSARDYVMAAERGETDGGTSTFIGLSQLFSGYIRERKLNILVQFAIARDANMPDVPTVVELAREA